MPYLDELEEGRTFRTPARTIYLHDITSFAQLSADWHPLHTDEEYAAASIHGGLIAHGTLVLAAATGLLARAGLFDDKAIAFLGVDWRVQAAVRPGDTIHVDAEVTAVRRSRSKPDRGIAEFEFRVCNQRDEVVADATWKNMFLVRSAADPAGT